MHFIILLHEAAGLSEVLLSLLELLGAWESLCNVTSSPDNPALDLLSLGDFLLLLLLEVLLLGVMDAGEGINTGAEEEGVEEGEGVEGVRVVEEGGEEEEGEEEEGPKKSAGISFPSRFKSLTSESSEK